MMTNRTVGTLYVGVTSDIVLRVWEHRQGTRSRFTARYKLKRLVYMEWHKEILAAIKRETRFKHWPRLWKLNLIEQQNPLWEDLFELLVGEAPFLLHGPARPGHPASV